MDDRSTEKQQRLEDALEQGMAMIHIDARRHGVAVPQHLRGEAHLRLNLSYRFEPADLTLNAWGVRSTLSFSGSRHKVAVPWSALFAVASHVRQDLFTMWPEDMPPELLAQAQPNRPVPTPASAAPEAPTAEEPAVPRRGHLRLVKAGE